MNSASSPLLRQLETLTRAFRSDKERAHRAKAAEARREYARHIDTWTAALGATPPRAGDAWEPPCDHHAIAMADGARAYVSAADWAVAQAEHAVTTQKWHEERARGQLYRFRNLDACGVRVRTTTCGTCGYDTRKEPVPEGCGIARLCLRCSLFAAKKRRARFGRARARIIAEAPRHLFRKKRPGGAYQERMLTVTIPHFTLEELAARVDELEAIAADDLRSDFHRQQAARRAAAARELLERCPHTVMARVEALWRAWPNFTRRLRGMWKRAGEVDERGEIRPQLHRAAEWTPGDDGLGHPHFHVWVWSPYLDVKRESQKLARMWTEALLEQGVPTPKTRDGLAILNVKRIYGFNNAMAAELMKGGHREALELSRVHYIDRCDGSIFFRYADGWTIHEVFDVSTADIVAPLYCALEHKRLTQASRGFFGEDPPPCCPFCLAVGGPNGWAQFSVTFKPRDEARAVCTHPRGPP